ncbi:GNAT family N-acetyltransferase [Aquihabitans daechungensis]|uniref:GNAT family N-acetyltransferase n=1 Tax=Aquihabitans daechungensis TaxID=1052257 RepID=UPI003BA2F302
MSERQLVVARTDELSAARLREVRALLDAAFDDPAHPDEAFDDDDWDHTLGGTHVLVLDGGDRVVSHAAVVDRILDVGGRPLRTGYVEGVATRRSSEGEGHGTQVMTAIGDLIAERHQLGALGTGAFHFYERLGWERWQGPSFVRVGDDVHRTPDDDEGIMVLRVDPGLAPDLTMPISCDDRPGDVW